VRTFSYFLEARSYLPALNSALPSSFFLAALAVFSSFALQLPRLLVLHPPRSSHGIPKAYLELQENAWKRAGNCRHSAPTTPCPAPHPGAVMAYHKHTYDCTIMGT